jgi:formylmethanofuran dehydrogenase subunit E
MNIGRYTFDEYVVMAAAVHGNPAPGLLIGGFMVELAKGALPEGTIFDAVVETPKCLPDAVQLLTLSSYGNGWMKSVNLGRYALALYDKYTGEGVRVWIDPAKLSMWPEIKAWYLKLKPKREQDRDRLFDEIKRAGPGICGMAPVKVADSFLKKGGMGAIAVCPLCGEAYPAADGGMCRGCSGEHPYLTDTVAARDALFETGPKLRVVARPRRGPPRLHDMTRVVPGESKDPAFLAGQLLSAGDVCRLHTMGRERVFVMEDVDPGLEWIHENEAAVAFARAMAGEGVSFEEPPREGKINFRAEKEGLLLLDRSMLRAFNMVEGVMCASRQGFLPVEGGKRFAACRAIPLYLSRAAFDRAMAVLEDGPCSHRAHRTPAHGHPGDRNRGLQGADPGPVHPHREKQGGEVRLSHFRHGRGSGRHGGHRQGRLRTGGRRGQASGDHGRAFRGPGRRDPARPDAGRADRGPVRRAGSSRGHDLGRAHGAGQGPWRSGLRPVLSDYGPGPASAQASGRGWT